MFAIEKIPNQPVAAYFADIFYDPSVIREEHLNSMLQTFAGNGQYTKMDLILYFLNKNPSPRLNYSMALMTLLEYLVIIQPENMDEGVKKAYQLIQTDRIDPDYKNILVNSVKLNNSSLTQELLKQGPSINGIGPSITRLLEEDSNVPQNDSINLVRQYLERENAIVSAIEKKDAMNLKTILQNTQGQGFPFQSIRTALINNNPSEQSEIIAVLQENNFPFSRHYDSDDESDEELGYNLENFENASPIGSEDAMQ
jgi:hypothetical protein